MQNEFSLKKIRTSPLPTNGTDKELKPPFYAKAGISLIGSEGIIGSRILVLTHGSSDARSVKTGNFLASIEPLETDAIISSLSVTADNIQVISGQMAEIMVKINNGNGTLARLIEDSTISENFNQMIINLKKGTSGLLYG